MALAGLMRKRGSLFLRLLLQPSDSQSVETSERQGKKKQEKEEPTAYYEHRRTSSSPLNYVGLMKLDIQRLNYEIPCE